MIPTILRTGGLKKNLKSHLNTKDELTDSFCFLFLHKNYSGVTISLCFYTHSTKALLGLNPVILEIKLPKTHHYTVKFTNETLTYTIMTPNIHQACRKNYKSHKKIIKIVIEKEGEWSNHFIESVKNIAINFLDLKTEKKLRYIHLPTKLGSLFCEKKGIKVKKKQHLKSENEKKNIQIGVFLGEKRSSDKSNNKFAIT
ncbi:hypothetical protein BpHYR1_033591 [Brachionus plicatilis]|uniref:Uncharacterized protein n=1 Tax=Brachionus plicatilis TaxID=10195 RepID=A0A3M7SMG5_BRAPC|nr:hypothetical protein BpHYR1_033591 [Brachionus plicatilis]